MPLNAGAGRSPLLGEAMTPEDFSDHFRATWFSFSHPGACFQQRLHGRNIVSRPAMPSVFRSMNRPSQGSTLEIGVGNFEVGLMAKDVAGHLRVAVKGGPVQRRGPVLPERVYRQAGGKHQAHCGRVVIAGGMSHVTTQALAKIGGETGIVFEQGGDRRFIGEPASIEQFYLGWAALHQ